MATSEDNQEVSSKSLGIMSAMMSASKRILSKSAFMRFIGLPDKPSKIIKKTGHWKDSLKEYIKVRPAPIVGCKDRPKVNDKCPYCASGKKFKICCGRNVI
ncbi:hypothetical protein DRO61_05350 [Candidatus Bathyarchaeota archaeon]|nr:MAG: hypothetical protein DRO61_05350 [Candidatus Bathyarchaeota archaeon]